MKSRRGRGNYEQVGDEGIEAEEEEDRQGVEQRMNLHLQEGTGKH